MPLAGFASGGVVLGLAEEPVLELVDAGRCVVESAEWCVLELAGRLVLGSAAPGGGVAVCLVSCGSELCLR